MSVAEKPAGIAAMMSIGDSAVSLLVGCVLDG
jgi:hypothetical protein